LDHYLQWDLASEEDFPFEREFDCVILGDIVEHLVDGAGLLLRVRKLLREDGKLIVSTPNIALWVYRLKLLMGRFDYDDMGIMDRTHVHFYTLRNLLDDLRLTGFTIISRHYTSIPFPLLISFRPLHGLARGLSHFYYILVRLSPRMFAYQFVILARIRRLEWREMRQWPDRLRPPHPHLRNGEVETDSFNIQN
jgi:SAM-dependent methyltransferase